MLINLKLASHAFRCGSQQWKFGIQNSIVQSIRRQTTQTNALSKQLSRNVNPLCQQPCRSNMILRRFSEGAKPKDPNKDQIIGGWLLGCSGMIFAAVVLGGAAYYYITYYSVRTVLDKALDPTSKKY